MRGFFLLLALLFFATAANAGYIIFYENGKAGIRDTEGKVILPASFDALGWTDNSFSVVNQVTGYRQQSRWGLINLKKEFITKPEYETLTSAGGDRVIASKKINPYTRKFGCIDLTGKINVPFHYDGISITGLRAVVFIKNGTRYEHGLIDLDDKSLIPLQFRDIRPIGSLRFAVQNFDRKTALFSEEGLRLTAFNIDSIATFYKGKAVIYEGVKQGLIDREGAITLTPSVREIKIGSNGEVTTRGFDTWKQIDASNKEIVSIEADELIAADSVYVIQLSGRRGIVNSQFNTLVPLHYNSIGPFQNNLAVAQMNDKYGVINSSGGKVIPFDFDSLVLENNFVRARTMIDGRKSWVVYDTFGIRKSNRNYDYVGAFNGKFFPARHHGYWGAFDRYGAEILACVYDSLIDFDGEVAAVGFKNLYGIIGYDEKWRVLPQPYPLRLAVGTLFFEQQDSTTFLKNFNNEILYFTSHPIKVHNGQVEEQAPQGVVRIISEQGLITTMVAAPLLEDAEIVFEESEGMRGIKRRGRYGFVDDRGRLRIANRYEGIGKFGEGLAPVMIMGKWGFVSREDKIVINPNYDYTDGFRNAVAIVGRNRKKGVIDHDGKVLLPIRYDSIAREGERLIIYDKGQYGLANMAGHVLIEPRFDALDVVNDRSVLVQRDNRWGVVTHEGLPLIPMMYDFMRYDPVSKKYLVVVKAQWTKHSY
jgi:hypothetical protein